MQEVIMLPSPATKAAAISDYLAGKGGYFQIANEYGISPFTLKKCVESPEKALNQASQKGIIELESSNHPGISFVLQYGTSVLRLPLQ